MNDTNKRKNTKRAKHRIIHVRLGEDSFKQLIKLRKLMRADSLSQSVRVAIDITLGSMENMKAEAVNNE